jgi:hypothetical protein
MVHLENTCTQLQNSFRFVLVLLVKLTQFDFLAIHLCGLLFAVRKFAVVKFSVSCETKYIIMEMTSIEAEFMQCKLSLYTVNN